MRMLQVFAKGSWTIVSLVLAGILLLGPGAEAQARLLEDVNSRSPQVTAAADETSVAEAQLQEAVSPEEERREVKFHIGSNRMEENGGPVEMDAAAYVEAGRTFVPARYLAEGLGAEPEHSPPEGPVSCVFLTREDVTVFISVGDNFITVHENDGSRRLVFLEAPSRIVDGRTYLPFRAIAEAFGAEVDFGPKTGPVEWVLFSQEVN